MNKRGFTLIELVVAVGIALALAGLAALSLRNAQIPAAETAAIVAGLIDDARAAAAANNGTGSGTVLVFTNTPTGARAQLFANRPLPGYDAPVAMTHEPPQGLPVPVAVDGGATQTFSLAIAPSGQVDVIRAAVKANSAARTSAPGCGDEGGTTVTIAVGTSFRQATVVLNCNDGTVAQAHV